MTLRWTIDVCATCGRLATWPFCEHRPTPGAIASKGWTVPIVVRPVRPSEANRLIGAA